MTRDQARWLLQVMYFVPWAQAIGLAALWAIIFIRMANKWALKYGVVAIPGPRSSHTQPTPRLGGLGIALSVFTVILVLEYLRPFIAAGASHALLIGAAYALAGGLLDDVADLPPWVKFLFQTAAAGSVVAAGVSVPAFALPGVGIIDGGFVGGALAFLLIVFMMNAYNFMDGMDGQAATFGIVVALGLLIPLIGPQIVRVPMDALVLATLIGSLFTFFMFNHPWRHPDTKTFMGDSGSQFVGFLLGATALRMSGAEGIRMPLAASAILVMPFAYDVVYTIARRLLRGENVVKPHRSHLYQRLLVAGWTHGQTLLLNGAFYIAYLLMALTYAGLPEAAREASWVADARRLLLATAVGGMAVYTLAVILVEREARIRAQTQK